MMVLLKIFTQIDFRSKYLVVSAASNALQCDFRWDSNIMAFYLDHAIVTHRMLHLSGWNDILSISFYSVVFD